MTTDQRHALAEFQAQFDALAAQPDGPQKKFGLIKRYGALLPENRREMSCAELVAIIRQQRGER